jgi:transposase-like protein
LTEMGFATMLWLPKKIAQGVAKPVNIIERGKEFVQTLRALAERKAWDWKRCPRCGETLTIKNGSYTRRPWFVDGRRKVRVQRHMCYACGVSYAERSAALVRGSWYAREVHRAAIDHWQHLGGSLRRTAEVLRSWLGHQERWRLWRPLDEVSGERCYLNASTLQRWLDEAGRRAQESVAGQWEGIGQAHTLSTDGLWAKLKGRVQRVVLLVMDSASGLIYPPVVAEDEKSEGAWQRLFERASRAGLELDGVRGVTSDGAVGLLAYLRRNLAWLQHQRCVWHIWRNLESELVRLARQATEGLRGEAAEQARQQVRDELTRLIHSVLDARSYEQAEAALAALQGHPLGAGLGKRLNEQLDHVLVHLLDYCRGLPRVTPEWLWRDFRLRLSRGRNHRSAQRLERAALLWAIYHNFEPAQWRSERKRHYRHPGQSALEVAGVPPGQVSYLDALGV